MSEESTPAVAPWGKWDKASLQLIFAGGIAYAAAVLVIGAVSIVIDHVTGERLLTLFVHQPLPAAADAGTATLIDGDFDTARVLVSGLSTTPAVLLTASGIIMVFTQLLVALSIVYLAWRLLRREPFLRSLTWAFATAGAVLAFGSLIGQALYGIGSWLAATELGGTPLTSSFWKIAFTIDVAPLGLGFVLLLVAAAFEYAQKLTVETRGLV